MNLDQYEEFQKIDSQGMLNEIDALPEQLAEAWKLGFSQPLPGMNEVNSVVIAGMGGSAIGADLLAASFADTCRIPISIYRDYGLPAWVHERKTLVILSSHSGNTEETLSAFEQAVLSKCQVVIISTGGKLLDRAKQSDIPAWTFVHHGQPRAAVGFSYGLLLALFTRLGLVPDVDKDVLSAIEAMRSERAVLRSEIPVKENPAKRLAGQMVGRSVTFFGAEHMVPVARRWKCQLNEIAKTAAAFESLPEADHNTLAGICFPAEEISKLMAVFIRSESDRERNALRLELTQRAMMVEGINTDSYTAKGKSKMEQLWRAIQFGDYMAYYLAMAYDVDPTDIPTITNLKQMMSQ